MKVSKFMGIFSHRSDVPIDPQRHVKKAMLEFVRTSQEIEFYPDGGLDINKMKGFIEHYVRKEDGDNIYTAKITYSTQMPFDEQRFVACKEMLHILDPVNARVSTVRDIGALIGKVILPRDRDISDDGAQAVTDYLAEQYAAGVMFPLAARNHFVAEVAAGNMTEADIHARIGIPLDYIRMVMAPTWPNWHSALLKL